MIHDLYIGDQPPSLLGNVSSEWDHRLWVNSVIERVRDAIRANPPGEQLYIVVRSYEL